MAKLLNTTFLVTQSAPSTPSSGFGTLFASSSKLYFKNTSGTTYDLTTAGGSGGYINVLTYTSSGTYTYNTGSGVQYIKVICAGSGGGGGGGRLGAVGSTRGAGGGGAGGNINMAYFSSSFLAGTYDITIAGGGNGGTNATGLVATNGGNGGTGLSSVFSTGSGISLIRLLSASGGPGGIGTNPGNGGGGVNIAPTTASVPNPFPPFYYLGVNGTSGSIGGDAANAFSGTRWLSGGGGGGAIAASNSNGPGLSGSAIYSYALLIRSGSPGAAGTSITNGGNGDNGVPVFDAIQLLFYSGSNISSSILVGTGGHGGGAGNSSPGTNAGSGGSGSFGAGGGGGGAASVSASISSGRGGPGGNGFVIIFEYY